MKNQPQRDASIRRALDDAKCKHPLPALCVDQETGDFFCGDCAAVTRPWAEQTKKQHEAYRWAWGDLPPAQRG
jgi:hypothetical protein